MTYPPQYGPPQPQFPGYGQPQFPGYGQPPQPRKKVPMPWIVGGICMTLVLLGLVGVAVKEMMQHHTSSAEPKFAAFPSACLPGIDSALKGQFGDIAGAREHVSNDDLKRTAPQDGVLSAICWVEFGDAGIALHPQGTRTDRRLDVMYSLITGDNAVGRAQDTFDTAAKYLGHGRGTKLAGVGDRAKTQLTTSPGVGSEERTGVVVFQLSNMVVRISVTGHDGSGQSFMSGEGRAGNIIPLTEDEAMTEAAAIAGALASALQSG